MQNLTDENFILVAAQHYDNPQCHHTAEFLDDLNRIRYIKKLITRYKSTGNLDERLVLNHLIILSNMFGPQFLARMVFLKMSDMIPYIKPFLVLINALPPRVLQINGKDIATDEYPMDEVIVEKCRGILKQ